jgi:hypothetical protein
MKKAQRKRSPVVDLAKDLWIAPRINLRGPDGNRAWDKAGNISPASGSRFLELADVALGHKKPAPLKKKAAAVEVHQLKKTEPYSR